jgi:hypothetical protein
VHIDIPEDACKTSARRPGGKGAARVVEGSEGEKGGLGVGLIHNFTKENGFNTQLRRRKWV